MKSNRC